MVPTDTTSDSGQFDVVVIGGGPAGYGAALYAGSAGLSVALVEFDRLGGTCLNRGCIPAKAFLETAAIHRHVAHAAEFGINSSAPTVDFAVTQARKQKIVDGLVKGVTGLMKMRKVDGVRRRRFADRRPHGPRRARRGRLDRRLRPGSRARLRLRTADDPQLRARRADHVERRGARARPCSGAGGGDRRWGDRVRVRLDLRRPRLDGDDPRGPAEDPSRTRHRCRQRRRAQLPEEEHRHPHRGQRHRPHARTGPVEPPSTSARTSRSRSTRSSFPSVDGRSPTSSASTPPG